MANLPIYKLNPVPNGGGIDYVALVDYPAIEADFLAFSKPIQFKVEDKEQRIVSGALMIPDKPIFRKADGIRPDHFVIFDKAGIKEFCRRFFRDGNVNKVNVMHTQFRPQSIYMIESFLIDSENGIAPKKHNLPDGTWFGTYKIDNDEIWQEYIKTGSLRGFSVEGFFEYEEAKEDTEKVLDEILLILQS